MGQGDWWEKGTTDAFLPKLYIMILHHITPKKVGFSKVRLVREPIPRKTSLFQENSRLAEVIFAFAAYTND